MLKNNVKLPVVQKRMLKCCNSLNKEYLVIIINLKIKFVFEIHIKSYLNKIKLKLYIFIVIK